MDDPRTCEDSYWLMMARGSEEDSGRRVGRPHVGPGGRWQRDVALAGSLAWTGGRRAVGG
jgi:hypothetical protein